MTKRTPSYLKLHTTQDWDIPLPDPVLCPPYIADICRVFTEATGWPLRFVPQPESSQDIDLLWSAPVNPGVGTSLGHLRIDLGGPGMGDAVAMSFDQVEGLADSLAELISRIATLEEAVRQREAELATGVPVIAKDTRGRHLADCLNALLKSAASSVGAEASALYVLDDATTELKLRASWGLTPDELLKPARALHSAIADLEALLGMAVTLENNHLYDYWRVPRSCGSAMCVPVSSSIVPLGTMWIYRSEPGGFDANDSNLIEIIAGRIAAELERDTLIDESIVAKDLRKQIEAAQNLQQRQLPRLAPLIDGWEIAGWTSHEDKKICGSFHDWFVLGDNHLAIAAGDALDGGVGAGLCVAGLRTSLRSHAEYPHNPKGLLERVNRTLWSSSAGDQFASLFYANIDQQSGLVQYSAAGRPMAWILGHDQNELLVHATWPLGVQPEPSYDALEAMVPPGGVLVICSGVGERLTSEESRQHQIELPTLSQHSADATAQQWVDHLRVCLMTPGSKENRSLLVVKRR